MNKNTKVFISSAIITDVVTQLFRGRAPIIITLLSWIVYVVLATLVTFRLGQAIIWSIQSIYSCVVRGGKVLCGI